MSTDPSVKNKSVREPSLVDALIPLIFMIVLLVTSIVLFGLDAAVGPLQVALAHECCGRRGRSTQEWPFLAKAGGGDCQRYLDRHECHPDPADGRSADRDVEYVRHDRHDGLLWC